MKLSLPTFRPTLIALLGATGLILLIAISNIANLLLARGSARQREFSVRAALGAGRARLARLLLTESLLLSALGGLGGLVLGFGGVRLLFSMEPAWIPRLPEIAIDGTVLIAAGVVTLASGVVFGFAQALFLRGPLIAGIRQASGGLDGGGRGWLRSGLVVSQLALSLVLLTGSGLMIRSFLALQSVPIGFDYRHIATFSIGEGGALIGPTGPARAARLQQYRSALAHVRAIPGVRGLTLTSQAPLGRMWAVEDVEVLTGVNRGQHTVDFVGVDENFFQFFGSRPVAGRLFEPADVLRADNVVVVDANLAQILWPGEPAVGQRVRFFDVESGVIGVAEPIRYGLLTDEMRPTLFHLLGRSGGGTFGGSVLVRHDGDAEAIGAAIRSRLKEVDATLQVDDLQPLAVLYDQSLREPRFYLLLLGTLGALGLMVATLGVYGVVAYSVARRTGEIGIRMVLGGRPAQIVRLFCRRMALLIAAGIGSGLLAAVWLTRYIRSLLFQVQPTDPVAIGAMTAILATTALAATLIPMRRALSVDPATTLRAE